MPNPGPQAVSPGSLMLRVAIAGFVVFAGLIALLQRWPYAPQHLPFGGRDALEGSSRLSAVEL